MVSYTQASFTAYGIAATNANYTGPTTNRIYVRATDIAGNTSTSLVQIGFKQRDAVAYRYDSDGNLLEFPVTPSPIQTNFVLSWDAENRLISMQRKYRIGGILQTNRSDYVYDSANRLRQVKEYSTNGVLTNTTRYIWAGWQLAGELDGSNKLVRSYTHGVDISGTVGGAAGIGGLVGIHSYVAPVTNYYARQDGKGNVTEVRRYNGTTAASYGYYEFGGVRYQTNTYVQNIRWQTRMLHPQSGLYFWPQRVYDPATGRWCQRDRIGELGGVNLYAYSKQNPLGFYDSLGYRVYFIARKLNMKMGGIAAHSFLAIHPDNPKDFDNRASWTIGAYNGGGSLVSRVDDSIDSAWQKSVKTIQEVPRPAKKTDTEFIRAIMAAFNRYESASRMYEKFPQLDKKEGNCHTVTAGALLGGGVSLDWIEQLDPLGFNPGLNKPLPEMYLEEIKTP